MNGSSMPSVMKHTFSRIPAPDIQRSVFERTHGHKTTFDEGYLIPFLIDEILPGDTLNLSATFLARMATPIFPLMDNIFFDTFYFFVPNRLTWSNWEKLQGAQDAPDDPIDYEVPVMSDEGSVTVGSQTLGDHFGLPVGVSMGGADLPIALPFRAYNLIWNEWFRDQNLQEKVPVNLTDGPDDFSTYILLRRGKRHDYFTSALPWPQKGDAISLPIGTTAPVIGNGTTLGLMGATDTSGTSYGLGVDTVGGINGVAVIRNALIGDPAESAIPAASGPTSYSLQVHTDPEVSGVIADLSNALAATINDLRQAFAFQQIIEADARGGTRYVEILKQHFGVTVPDFRLQRPEYLGGSSQRVDIHGVAQTSSTDATSPQGNLSAYGQVSTTSGFSKSFVEHGYLIGLCNVRADITYQQGMERLWSRRTRYDFYMPALAHLGEQPVYNREIFMSASPAVNLEAFGYQERWAEYRYKPSKVTGLFRSDAAGSLDAWHLATDFSDTPVLNTTFIQDDPPIERVIAVPSEPHFIMDSYIKMRHARPMPIYSVPGLQRL